MTFDPTLMVLLGSPDPAELVNQAEEALAGGATAIQLRVKGASARSLTELGGALAPPCRAAGASLIINDRVDVAMAVEAHGVHVGPQDLPAGHARHLLGPSAIVGSSARDPKRGRILLHQGVSYLGVGALRGTPTKPEASVIGLEGIARMVKSVPLPVIAIGGVLPQDCSALRTLGVKGIAVVGGILRGGSSIREATRNYREAWNG